jgi:hypothetical protein
MKYRIIKHDKHNWAIQEFQEGGGEVSRGPHVGKEKQEKWKAPKSFYPSVRHAAMGLLDQAAGDALLSGEAASILDALKIAETRVQATLAVMDMGVTCPPPLDEGKHLYVREE